MAEKGHTTKRKDKDRIVLKKVKARDRTELMIIAGREEMESAM